MKCRYGIIYGVIAKQAVKYMLSTIYVIIIRPMKKLSSFCKNVKMPDVKNVIIDAEVNSYQPDKNAGPFYFTETEFNVAHYLEQKAI